MFKSLPKAFDVTPTWRRVAIYSALSTLLAALVDIIVYLMGGLTGVPVTLGWGAIRMYTPTASALLVAGHREVKGYLRLGRKVLVFYLTSPLIAYLAILLYLLIIAPIGLLTLEHLQVELPITLVPEVLIVLMLLSAYFPAITINTLFALGEEIGWRGFLQIELEALGLSLAKAALLVGLVWGVWHAPAILLLGYNYPDNPVLGALLFTAFTVTLSLPHAIIRHLSLSVIPAASLHGTVNAIWGLTVVATRLPRELGGLGPLGIAVWVIISLILHLALRRQRRATS
ncbi:hypothetical protein HRbin02_01102 [Candidatus Calditenuaceae archaeon HR02]|nr:hypothetical protein HRbin02_01102 [Candidatus Calditenuaceae archaeon HR02]